MFCFKQFASNNMQKYKKQFAINNMQKYKTTIPIHMFRI